MPCFVPSSQEIQYCDISFASFSRTNSLSHEYTRIFTKNGSQLESSGAFVPIREDSWPKNAASAANSD